MIMSTNFLSIPWFQKEIMKYELSETLICTNSMGPNPIKLLHWNLQDITILQVARFST